MKRKQYLVIDLMNDDVLLPHASLLCSFCKLFPHFMLAHVLVSIPVLWEHIHILNVRLRVN